MQFFLDTANIEDIRQAAAWGMLDGVTTNPSLLARENGDWKHMARTICSEVIGPVSLEVVGETAEEMVDEARKLRAFGENVVVKIPMCMEGMRAVRKLEAEGIRTNVTLVFSPHQVLLAAKAGASYVSPFVGRLDDTGDSGMEVVAKSLEIVENYDFDTKVLVASVRNVAHVLESALLGAHVITLPLGVLRKLALHPLTDKGTAAFLADWQKVIGRE